jgi:myo-inositol-1(or 4)-monophosphatase
MDLLKIAKDAASEAQQMAKKYINDAGVLSSIEKDIKTEADLVLNDCIIRSLSSTHIPVISEEIENIDSDLPDQCWIIDPLDGTYNFSRGYPTAAISIAFWEKNTPVLGVVADIFRNIIYSAHLGKGCYIQEASARVSSIDEIGKAILATGFPSGSGYQTKDLLNFVSNVQSFKKVRTIGSAALMLSYVAAGVFDVYYEKDIYIWDVAAGLALVKEAGGEIFYKARKGRFKYEVLASNRLLFADAKKILLNS